MAKFQPGHKLAKGGKREGAGRRPKGHLEIEKAAAEIARDYIEASVKPVMQTYFQLAHGRLVNKWHDGEIVGQEFEPDPATTRHFMDKLIPALRDEEAENIRPIQIAFVNYNSVQLHAAGVSSTVLSGDGQGVQQGAQGVASKKRQGQNGLKFLDFKDVP